MIDEIAEHFKNEYPREGCGVISLIKGKKEWCPCTNLAEDNQDFILNPIEYLNIRRKGDIYAIVHSHPDSTNEASENDIKYCDALGIPYWIFDYPGMNLNIINPKEHSNPLIGREYEFGINDCLEAVRDYYKKYLNIVLPTRLPYLDHWWEKGHNYFTEEHLKEWGFTKVKNPEPNDIVIFTVGSSIPNHCGVYLGNEIFFHHAANRLSCRENLYPLWKKYLTGVFRYDT